MGTQPPITITHVATGLQAIFENYYLTEFQDSIDTSYNKVSTFGRMDPIVNYQGSQRKISIGFELQPENDDLNLKLIHQQITILQKMQYPVYEKGANSLTIQRPPLVLVRLANLVRSGANTDLLCAMEGFAFTPKTGFTPEDSPLVRFGARPAGQPGGINKSDESTGDVFYFQNYSFKFDLTVLHRSPVGFADSEDVTQITDLHSNLYTDEFGDSAENMRFLGGYYFGSHNEAGDANKIKLFATTPNSNALSVQELADVQSVFNTTFRSGQSNTSGNGS